MNFKGGDFLMAKRILFLALVLCVILAFIPSCGGGSEDVSVFYYTFSDTYISGVRTSMDKLLRREGLNYHNYDANGNQSVQTEQIDTAIAKGTKLLVVNIVDTGSDDAARTIIEKAKAKDIPVIFFNRSVSENIVKSYEKCVFVGTDYEMAGVMQGELIGSYLLDNYNSYDLNQDGVISYVLFKGQQGNLEAEARTKYAVESANKILNEAGKPSLAFYDKANKNGYLVDQDGLWSNAAANNYMKTILSSYSEGNKNMVELVIANNDEMALGALSALSEAGYNKMGGKIIPIFGIDASEGAVAKINDGFMAGTIRQDGEGMADAIVKIALNFKNDEEKLSLPEGYEIIGDFRVNIPYSLYTKEEM